MPYLNVFTYIYKSIQSDPLSVIFIHEIKGENQEPLQFYYVCNSYFFCFLTLHKISSENRFFVFRINLTKECRIRRNDELKEITAYLLYPYFYSELYSTPEFLRKTMKTYIFVVHIDTKRYITSIICNTLYDSGSGLLVI